MQFAMVAMSLIVAIICIVIAYSVLKTSTNNFATNGESNFTGLSATIMPFVIPLVLLGLLVYVFYAFMSAK